MSIFKVTDANTSFTNKTNGFKSVYQGVTHYELNTQSSTDGQQISANTTSNVVILTGSGNDTIDLSHATGMSFVDAGTGSNVITAGSGPLTINMEGAPYGSPQVSTSDLINNFHAGDTMTFDLPDVFEFIRGNNTVVAAFNPAVAGSAVSATFTDMSPSGLGITHSGNLTTLSA